MYFGQTRSASMKMPAAMFSTTPPTVPESEKKKPILVDDSEMEDKQDPLMVNMSSNFHIADGRQAMFNGEGHSRLPKNM